MIRPPQQLSPIATHSWLDQARQVLRTESTALGQVADRLGETFVDAVQLIQGARGHVVVTGMGKAGLIGQKVAATFSSTGTPAHFLHPAEACHGDLGRVHPGDVVVAFSHSGETAELLQILGPLRDLDTSLIAITGRPESSLARSAEIALTYGPIEEACPIGLAPSTSCAVMLGMGDALAFVLMRERQFGQNDFRRFHPAGSLGKQLRRVEEVMRSGGQLRVADCRLSVREAFVSVQKRGRRSGAILLIEQETERLAGIFTDSDLARLLESDDMLALSQPIADVMTLRPITVEMGCLVADVLEVFRTRQVSEIPVLDSTGRPVGLVDITDLMDLLPEAA